jgi:predicted AlkP superfamily phosphohydrolase/phosphomutase
MRYLRMLVNSVVAACLATAYVLVLILLLNPTIPLQRDTLVPLVVSVGLFYGVQLTVVLYVLLLVWQFLARFVFSPAWVSVGALVWLTAMSSIAGGALMWRNMRTFGNVLDPETGTALNRSVIVLFTTAILCLVVAWLRHRSPERRKVWAVLLVLVASSSVVLPLVVRGAGTRPLVEARSINARVEVAASEVAAKVIVLAIDAASLDFITRATAEGRLPNFGRILDAGAVRHIATIHPTSAEAVWAAVATGKLPQKNGVRSAGIYQVSNGGGSIQLLPDYCFAYRLVRYGFLVEQPHSSATFQTRTLWNILGTNGFSVGVVAWPLTQPAPAVRGYIVSDTYHRTAPAKSTLVDQATVYPQELKGDALTAMEQAAADTAPAMPAASGDPVAADPRQEAPARIDRVYDRIARALAQVRPTQVTVTRYQSLDTIGHYFLRYAMPSEFGDVSESERQRLGAVLDRQYSVIDESIGRAMAALGPDDLLLVVSGFGMEPLGPGKRLIERLIGDPDISGTHEAAPDGFLLAYGSAVASGRQQQRASVVDIAPTILYFLGLPIGRDMDGYARTDLFQQAFTQDHPISFVPTYDR